jgi:Putative transposase of IS4/5 family (DUF4096)
VLAASAIAVPVPQHFQPKHLVAREQRDSTLHVHEVVEDSTYRLKPVTGARWPMLPQGYPNYKTVHHRFQQWGRDEVLRKLPTDLANTLREESEIDESECFIDAIFSSAKGGGDEIVPMRRGKGVKIMAILDRQGLPLAVGTYAANHDAVTLVKLSFDFYMIEAKPENLIGDRASDSDQLDEQLRRAGVEIIAPHKSTRKRKTQARCAA